MLTYHAGNPGFAPQCQLGVVGTAATILTLERQTQEHPRLKIIPDYIASVSWDTRDSERDAELGLSTVAMLRAVRMVGRNRSQGKRPCTAQLGGDQE